MSKQLFFAIYIGLCWVAFASGYTVGPLPFEKSADSPFDLSGRGTSFFVDDFDNGVNYVLRHNDAFNYDYRTIKLKTPGAFSSGSLGADRYGNALIGETACTDSIPGSCSTGLEIDFDESELGFLPQAVGIAVDNFAFFGGPSTSLFAFDRQGQVIEGITAIGSIPPIGPATSEDDQQLTGPITITYPSNVPSGYTFLGLVEPVGISRLYIGGSFASVSEIQYGLLTPEPSSLYIALFGVCLVSPRRRY